MAYKATVELLIDVETYPEACDAVAEMLREHLRQQAPRSVLVDWRYHPDSSPEGFGPVEVAAIPPDFTEDSDWPPVTEVDPYPDYDDQGNLKPGVDH